MVTRRDLVLRALTLAGVEASADEWDDESRVVGVFVDLRNQPGALQALLDGVPDAEEICRRYSVLREAARAGRDPQDNANDGYFVVRAPKPIARDRAEQRLREHYANMARLASDIGDRALARAVRAPATIEWKPSFPEELARDALDAQISEAVGDRLAASASEHPILGLREAAYGIAAAYDVARYLVWPAYRSEFTTPDPYAPYVELWSHSIRFLRNDSMIVAVAPPPPRPGSRSA